LASDLTRSFIMSLAKAKTTQPANQAAAPTYPIGAEQLNPVLAALPTMIDNAPLRWQRTRRRWILNEIAAFRPADALEAGLAGQIVVLRHVAVRMLGEAHGGAYSPRQARRLARTSATMLQAGERLARALQRWQKCVVRMGWARAQEGVDLAAGDAGRRGDAAQGDGNGDRGEGPSPSTLRGSTSPAPRARCRKTAAAA